MNETPQGEPHLWTATETVGALRAGRIGAVELLDHYLARQARLDGAVNAVVQLDAQAARTQAAAVDAGAGAGAGGALAGLPMTIKDCHDVAGFRTTAGIPDLAENRPLRDGDAVARLRREGAVIFGKTNVPVAASDHQSYNPIFGLTRNPWNLERSAGGSSGGSAAALAAGLTPLELGSDIAGSIRVPAHFCGVYGHKPSWGIVSSRGHVPPAPGARTAAPLAVTGPLGRSAADLRLALGLIAGPGAAATPGWRLDLPAARVDTLSGARVALWLDGHAVDSGYAAAIEGFAADLEAAGARVARIPGTPAHLVGAVDLYFTMLFAVIGAGSPPEELEAYRAAAGALPDHPYAGLIARATRASSAEWVACAERQAAVIEGWRAVFADHDVVLSPVCMNAAFPHQTEDGFGPLPQLHRTLQVDGGPRAYMDNLLWPAVATLAHLPATVRPLPGRVHGMPAGVQIMGGPFEDLTTLRFAELCDTAFGRAPLAPDFV